MNKTIVQNLGDVIYLWRLRSTKADLPDHISGKCNTISDHLINKFFEIEQGETESLQKDCKFYLKSISNLIPNFCYKNSSLFENLQELFNSYHQECIELRLKSAESLIEEVRSKLTFNSTAPKYFVKDLLLAEEQSKFKTKIVEKKSLMKNGKFIQVYLKHHKDFIRGFKTETEKLIENLAAKVLEEYEESLGKLNKTIKNTVSELVKKETELDYEEFFVETLQLNENEEQVENWALIYKTTLVSEPVTLTQAFRCDHTIFILLSLENTSKTMILLYERFLVRPLAKLFPYKSIKIANGSVPESLIIYENSEKLAWEAYVSESKIKILQNLPLYPKKAEIFAACYVKHEKKIFYIYSPGGISHYNIGSSPLKDLGTIVPQSYSNMFISDCERFLLLISDVSFYLFEYKSMRMIDLQRGKPIFCVFFNEILRTVVVEDGCFSLGKYRIGPNYIQASPDTELKLKKAMMNARRTIEIGLGFFKNITREDEFDDLSKK